MVAVDTFLTQLYVMVDDVCQSHFSPELTPGPEPALTRSEVVTLALFAQWSQFASERDFYRYAARHLRSAFPALPDRTQFNRACRRQHEAIVAFCLYLGQQLGAPQDLYEAMDTSAVPTRNLRRRGGGWLCGQASIGWSNGCGWFEGLRLLVSVNPAGVVTGFGLATGSAKDQPMAEMFLALRHQPDARLSSVGAPARGVYVADKGFAGRHQHQRWREQYQAEMVCAPQRHSREDPHPWPRAWRRWLAGLRQIVETVFTKLQEQFRLHGERPHLLAGIRTRVAAKLALHNFCIWLNRQLGRPSLAFVDLVDW